MGGFPEWEDRDASIAPLEFNGIPWISTMELVGLEGGDSRNRRVSEHSGMGKLEMGVATRTRVPLGGFVGKGEFVIWCLVKKSLDSGGARWGRAAAKGAPPLVQGEGAPQTLLRGPRGYRAYTPVSRRI